MYTLTDTKPVFRGKHSNPPDLHSFEKHTYSRLHRASLDCESTTYIIGSFLPYAEYDELEMAPG